MGTVDGMQRRRSRQAVLRPRTVQFSLSEEEFVEVSEAATRSGLARGAFAAEAALATSRGTQARVWSPLRAALAELMTAAGLARRSNRTNSGGACFCELPLRQAGTSFWCDSAGLVSQTRPERTSRGQW